MIVFVFTKDHNTYSKRTIDLGSACDVFARVISNTLKELSRNSCSLRSPKNLIINYVRAKETIPISEEGSGGQPKGSLREAAGWSQENYDGTSSNYVEWKKKIGNQAIQDYENFGRCVQDQDQE